jgi:hypothetical protein
MAASFTVRIMEDGPRNAILLINGNNGGSTTGPVNGADLAYQALILPSQLGYVDITRKQRCASLRVDTIEWDIQTEAQYQVDLFWDATTPVEFYSCIGRANKFFKNFGGLYQQVGIAGTTGGIGISTLGGANTTGVNQSWTITLYLIKNGLNPA